MSTAKEIRNKIKTIHKTKKICRAMEMVAASKMRKCQERRNSTSPYAEKIKEVIGHLAKGHPEYQHIYMRERDVKRVGFIIVSSDRGLCGSLNVNLLKATVKKMRELSNQNYQLDICTIGNKAEHFFRRYGGNVVATANQLGDAPTVSDIVGIVKTLLDDFEAGKLKEIYIVHNEFINTMVQKPIINRLLPLVPMEDTRLDYYWDYIYEPDARDVIDELMKRYIESHVFQGVVENIACEQAARMVAMKSASDNAGKLIDELNLIYNKARQASITQEIAEIVSGADAV